MDVLINLLGGLATIFTPFNLLVMVIGLVLGMLVAVLPGLTLVMGVVLALPFTYKMGVAPALILLTAMYVSGTYAGAMTAILFRIPGEPMDVPLLWDGYAMTRRGEAAKALGWSLSSALIGGLASAVLMVALAKPVALVALKFSSPEFFAVVFFGLASVVALSGGSVVNSLISLCLGLFLATVGVDSIYGAERFAFGQPFLLDGIEFLLVMVGAYGIGEVMTRLNTGFKSEAAADSGDPSRFKTALPSLKETLRMKYTLLRGTLTGIIVGVVPGAGATVSAFVAYGIESQYGKNGKALGTGVPEGIVVAKSAATASVGGALVPLLAMGIPGSGATAIILAAFLLHGIQPGPQVFVNSPDLVYTVFASVFVALIGMCILGYFAIKPLCKVLDAPEAIVSAFVVLFCFVGAFAARNSLTDLYVISAFGVIGFLFERFKFPIAPLVLGTILGPLAESNFMTTMVSYDNDWTVFFTRPISAVIMALSFFGLAYPVLRAALQRLRPARPQPPESKPARP
ncbi:tripartite tricarboxylate transporter permease [Methylibium sp.]|uniref:tripartite tricarboxylate transporter permease n=1 Tax=Methylibium sp. TaxID=2067992 RepID=UPI0017F36E89|nr:tripartite tricarboxylate transporter permease [Methylibium sp.]MBA3591150.1 tripartite tricarboxylate transporter permease [Methylibium sp.]